MLEEITKDLYLKYLGKHKQEQVEIQRNLQEIELHASNPEDYAQDLHQTWLTRDYLQRQKLQNYLFPKGLRYCKYKGLGRTEDFNSVFLWMARKQQDLAQKNAASQV